MVLGGIIAAFLLLDLLDMRATTAWPLGLDSENAPNVAFASLLLVGAGCLALVQALYSRPRAIPLAMAAILFFMGYDEAFEFHEELESRLEADWQMLYLPVALAFGAVWLAMLIRKLPAGLSRGLWMAGAASWFVAQTLEQIQWDGDRLVHEWMIVPEEILEMTGSALWLIALLVAVRALASARAPASSLPGSPDDQLKSR